MGWRIGIGCLTPFSTIIQLYHGIHFIGGGILYDFPNIHYGCKINYHSDWLKFQRILLETTRDDHCYIVGIFLISLIDCKFKDGCHSKKIF